MNLYFKLNKIEDRDVITTSCGPVDGFLVIDKKGAWVFSKSNSGKASSEKLEDKPAGKANGYYHATRNGDGWIFDEEPCSSYLELLKKLNDDPKLSIEDYIEDFFNKHNFPPFAL